VRALTALALIVLPVTAVSACASSSPSRPAAQLGTPTQQDCTPVADVLSDGPDPSADPVGYAQAQVLPLGQLKIADEPLRRAVQALAAAYKAFSSTGGGSGTTAARQVSTAQVAVNKLCPQAAP
jgi:hypothetical protein